MSDQSFFVFIQSDAYHLKVHVETNSDSYVFGTISRSEKANEWPNADKEYVLFAECWKPLPHETGLFRTTLNYDLMNQWGEGAMVKLKVVILDITTTKGTGTATLTDGSTGSAWDFVSGKGTAVLSNGSTSSEREMI